MAKAKLALVLGIRPDIIRASLIIKEIDKHPDVQLLFIWSGQHYSDNLKDVFFRELGVRKPDIELGCSGTTDAEIASQLVIKLYDVLSRERPDAVVFLGDTNTVSGCVAAAQLNIPIVHIEGCMRSYDWRMPEEKYRTLIDHLSDVIYAYLPSYKNNGVIEGIDPKRIVVTSNPIVDVINTYSPHIRANAKTVLAHYGLKEHDFVLMTSHRRENVEEEAPLRQVLALAGAAAHKVLFPASYRTQKSMQRFGLKVPPNVHMVDPLGYNEFLGLLSACKYTITDSGTVVEEACVLGIPSVQMRKSTERPEVYDVGASIRFDPAEQHTPEKLKAVIARVESLHGKHWENPFGTGDASKRIAEDLLQRAAKKTFNTHAPDLSRAEVQRAMHGNSNGGWFDER